MRRDQADPGRLPQLRGRGQDDPVGPGVERLAEEVAERFPNARPACCPRTCSIRAGAERGDRRDRRRETDIIIGTQLVAKGHNFPRLTLVGVIDADLGLQGADLRAAERSFS
jgi:primosomal protein N' (replication factor Y)